jgi:DNA helicase-2/ATP-dependent DNA helicase PcrA
LEHLNAAQYDAVYTTEGPVRVIAGAGTGKTRALTSRFCYLVSALGIAPKNILCVTFTNRAANEMKRRVRALLGDLDLGYICTFHAFCVQLLKEDIHRLQFPRNFVILDVEDQRLLLQKIFDDMGLTMRDATIQRTIAEVLEAKKMHDGYIADICELDNEQLKEKYLSAPDQKDAIFLRYLYEQKKCFGCDFNDLINFATYLLSRFPDVREKWRDRMQYVMVDEFQDVSKRQYTIAQILSEKHGNLFIVGDPDQTIYSWRGSHVKLFMDFDQLYPAAKTIPLTDNYRSSPEILAATNTLISKNVIRYPKDLKATRPGGRRPLYNHAKTEQEEAAWIHEEICRLQDAGVPLGSIAILYRAHYLTRALEECFIEKRLPYTIFSGVEFYGRKEIRDVICYLRMVTAADNVAFLRTVNTPPRKIGQKKLEALQDYAEGRPCSLYQALKDLRDSDLFRGTQAGRYIDAIEFIREHRASMRMGDALQTLLDLSGYEAFMRQQGDQERLDNLAELKRSVETAGQDEDAALEDFLTRAALFTSLDKDDKPDAIKLMTIHTAKGMEFPYVFVCGLNEGVFPSRQTATPEDMDEERRIAYVAMTRAMDALFLSDSEGVSNDGIFKYPSRFIFDAGKENLDYVTPLDPSLEEKARAYIERDEAILKSRQSLFEAGDRVIHSVFGPGTVTDVRAAQLYYVIRFDSLKTDRNIQFGVELLTGDASGGLAMPFPQCP